ncbi:MAG TPA: hypothetical protein VNL70_07480 [Tepidisphaeraceae bacterium]|nr:hypothetical protein [Tepidisphaeraceae bacterium]
MTMDVLAGLFLLASLATVIVVTLNPRHRVLSSLTSQRDALHAAEQALHMLQTTRQLPQTDLIIIPTGHRLGDYEWCQITASRNGRRVSLVGLAPAGLVPASTRSAGAAP